MSDIKNEKLDIIRHSAAHVMAEAVLKLFPGSKIAIGPAIDTGFYYDFDLSRPITNEDLPEIEKEMRRIISGNHEFVKKYYALVNGVLNESGHLENYLFKDEDEVKSYVGNINSGKIAILDYQVVKVQDNNTLVDISLKTGRHHQIRVQFSHINHPLVGDSLYGNDYKNNLMLYAYSLSFYHPITKQILKFKKIPTHDKWQNYF